jgi:hypothetical protein
MSNKIIGLNDLVAKENKEKIKILKSLFIIYILFLIKF